MGFRLAARQAPPGSCPSAGVVPALGLMLRWPSAGKPSAVKARSSGRTRSPSLSPVVKHDGGACSAAAAARGSVGTPLAAAPRPPPDLLLSNTTACPACLYKTCQEWYFCSRLDGIWLFWKPDPEHLALLCFALPILDLYGVRQRVSFFQEAVPETIAVASASVFSF